MHINDWVLNKDAADFFSNLTIEYKLIHKNILTSLKQDLEKTKQDLKRDIEVYNDIISMLNKNDIKEDNGILIYKNIKIYNYNNINDNNTKQYYDIINEINIEIEELMCDINASSKGLNGKRKRNKDKINRLTNELSILEKKKDNINNIIISKNNLNNLTDKQKSLIKYFFEYKEKLLKIPNIEAKINRLNKTILDRDILNITIESLIKKGIIKKDDFDYIDSFIASAFNYEQVSNDNPNHAIINSYIKILKNNPRRKKELDI